MTLSVCFKTYKKDVIVTFVLILAVAASYVYFASYQPKILRQLQEVRGVTAQGFGTPLLSDASSVSYNSTNSHDQTTYATSKTPTQVQAFYKNYFIDDNWVLTSQSVGKDGLVFKYKNDLHYATVSASKPAGSNNTAVSVDIAAR